jgi:hypothetical protein
MKWTITLALALAPILATQASSTTVQRFCDQRVDSESVRAVMMRSENRLAFRNQGGLVNGGVCWWHSRFQRNATYLTQFRPELPRPDEKEARKLIHDIRLGKKIIEIPGFGNLRDFSIRHRDLIQDQLNDWQLSDAFVRQQWLVGLFAGGGTQNSAERLKERMDELFDRVVVEGEIVFQVLQMKGVVAHAWLVLGAVEINNGYRLTVLDSNFADPYTVDYRFGDTTFDSRIYGPFIPATAKASEGRRLEKIVDKYCRKN